MLRMDDFAGVLAALICHIVLSSFLTTWNDEEETYESLLDMTLLLASLIILLYTASVNSEISNHQDSNLYFRLCT